MDGAPQSRITVALALAVIVAVVALVIVGVVSAPTGDADHADEASLAVGDLASPTTEVTVGDDDVDEHAHDDDSKVGSSATTILRDDEKVATAAGGPGTHGHAATSGGSDAVSVTDVAHAHDVVVTQPAAPDAPAVTTTLPVHDHGAPTTVPSTAVPSTPATTVPSGPIVSIDDPRLTPTQQAAAQSLLDRTRTAMAGFTDEAAVLAAGYVSIGDAATGFEHFVNLAHLTDDAELDPNRIESIVLRVSGGTKAVASAMYILKSGSTMADVPDIAGELTTWHDHQNLCWDGIRVVAVTAADGTCPRGEFRPTAPMLHVWLTPQACGPFSGIEGTHGDGCATHEH